MPRINVHFVCEEQNLTPPSKRLRAGDKNYFFAIFDLCEQWQELQVRARFRRADMVMPLVVDLTPTEDGKKECQIPWEVLTASGTVYVGIFAGDLILTNEAPLYIDAAFDATGGEDPQDPTRDWFLATEEHLAELDEKVAEAVEPPVKSVNGQKGAVVLNAEDVGALPADTQIPTVPTNVSAFSNDAGYATEKQVTQAVAAVADTIPDVPTNVSAFNNDAGYQTAAQVDATARARASEVEAKIPTVPTNVSAFTNDANYQSGEKVTQAIQAASDLLTIEINKKAAEGHTHDDRYYTETETDALLKKKQDSISHYVATVNGQSGDVSVTVGSIGAEAAGTAAAQVTAHNTDDGAHNDIRLLLQQLTERVNTVLDSDDTTLDQMSEIVAYIKEHSDLLDAVTTQKISYSDIVDNLTTNVSSKPLSAAQGVALKALIDAIVIPTKVSELTNDANYQNADQVSETASAAAEAAAAEVEAKIPTVPTNVSAFTNDAGYATETQVTQAAAAVEAKIPTVPTNVSAFTNDAGYQTAAQVSATANAAAAAVEAMIPTVPSNVSVFTNDADYQTGAQVSATASAAAAKVDNTFIFETVVSLSASGLSVSLPEGVTYTLLTEKIAAGYHVIGMATVPAEAGSQAGTYVAPFTHDWQGGGDVQGDLYFSTTSVSSLIYFIIKNDNTVEFNYYNIERKNNKVTSLSASSTDNQYPSAKAVYNLVGGLTLRKAYDAQPASPAEGDIFYDTENKTVQTYTGGAWSAAVAADANTVYFVVEG